jgi:hypothetical protein
MKLLTSPVWTIGMFQMVTGILVSAWNKTNRERLVILAFGMYHTQYSSMVVLDLEVGYEFCVFTPDFVFETRFCSGSHSGNRSSVLKISQNSCGLVGPHTGKSRNEFW